MPQDCLLTGDLPHAFECQVRGRMALPHALVELHEYRFGLPQQALFEQNFAFLDLALSRRPGEPRGEYIDAAGAKAQRLGDIIFIPARHRLRSVWGAGSQRSICCRLAAPVPEERGIWMPGELEASLDVRSPALREALQRLAREIETPGFGSELMAEGLCLQIAVELGRYFRNLRPDASPPGGRLSAAQLRLIEARLEQPGKPPSAATLARACGISARHLFRVFRATTGTTLSVFAARRRILRAKEMLGAASPPIKQIAYRCGFETPAAFSAAFRRETGVTPRAYRAQTMS